MTNPADLDFAPGVSPELQTKVTIAYALSGLHRIHGLFEAARAQVELATGTPLCVPGCGQCCLAQTPMGWELEAAHAASKLYGDARLRHEVKSRSLAWLRSQRNINSGQGIEAASRAPCPYMMASKGCLIYEGRPLVCRAYGVTRVPADYCQRNVGHGELPNTRLIFGGPGEAELRQHVDDLYHRIQHNRLGRYSFFPILLLVELGVQLGPVPLARIPIGMLWQDQVENINYGTIEPLSREAVL